jgi:hypothetical protein
MHSDDQLVKVVVSVSDDREVTVSVLRTAGELYSWQSRQECTVSLLEVTQCDLIDVVEQDICSVGLTNHVLCRGYAVSTQRY